MPPIKTELSSLILESDYISAKYNFVLSKFPDCKVSGKFKGFLSKNPIFVSKTVNSSYSKLIFEYGYKNSKISVMPVCELDFEYNGNVEKITIYSSPKTSLLAKINHKYIYDVPRGPFSRAKSIEKTIRFSRLSFNLKNHNFDDKMLNECRTNILKFIKENPGAKIDEKHLEPRLKKLLVFN